MIPKNFKGKATLTRNFEVGGQWDGSRMIRQYKEEQSEVNVMAVADGYAMVRKPRCMPFVCTLKELREITKENNNE